MEIEHKYNNESFDSAVPRVTRIESSLGKEINKLRVAELRVELEKRGLDKSGLKAVLVERLERSVLDASGDQKDSSEISQSQPTSNKMGTNIVKTSKDNTVACKDDEQLPDDIGMLVNENVTVNQANSFQGDDKDKEATAPLKDKTPEKSVESKKKACMNSEAISSESGRLTTPSCCGCLGIDQC